MTIKNYYFLEIFVDGAKEPWRDIIEREFSEIYRKKLESFIDENNIFTVWLTDKEGRSTQAKAIVILTIDGWQYLYYAINEEDGEEEDEIAIITVRLIEEENRIRFMDLKDDAERKKVASALKMAYEMLSGEKDNLPFELL